MTFETSDKCAKSLVFWENYFNESLSNIKNKGTSQKPYGRGNVYSFGVASALNQIGYLYVGLRRYSEALGAFHQMTEFHSLVYEKFYQGLDINTGNLAAGNWQILCLSLLTRNNQVINRFNNVYKLVVFGEDDRFDKLPESLYIGQVLSLMVEGHLSEAKDILLYTKRPKLDPRFRGTYEILDAIAETDEKRIVTMITEGGIHWQKYMRRNRDEVDSISFLYGAGFHHLAETILCKNIELSIPQIPQGMVGNISYEPYPIPDYAFL